MQHVNEIKTLLDSALKKLCDAGQFDSQYMLKAQKLGLQGEKRRLRYHTAKLNNLINYFKCDFFDVYGADLSHVHQPVAVATVSGIPDFFQKYLQNLEALYDALHSIANSLVAANGQCYAKRLYEKCDCLIDCIKYYRRTISEGEAVGWKPEFIYLHQTTACNVHDGMEELEKEIGYKY